MDVKKQLLQLYQDLNKTFFEGTLPPVLFRISFADKQVNWSLRYLQDKQYCMFINWTLLDCTEEELYINMLHQMAHIENDVNGISDTSRMYQYHNGKWNKVVNRLGIKTEFKHNFGHYSVGIDEETVAKIHAFFNYDRYKQSVQQKENVISDTESVAMVAFKCPRCNRIIKAKPTNKLICGFCLCDYFRME